jgi:hypothetical protein
MTVFQLVNDLLGITTYGEALEGLSEAYDTLLGHGARHAARLANDLRNDIAGNVIIGEKPWEASRPLGVATPQRYYDEALHSADRQKLRTFADWLKRSALPGGDTVDPDAKPDIVDLAGDMIVPVAVGSFSLLLVAALLWVFLSRR